MWREENYLQSAGISDPGYSLRERADNCIHYPTPDGGDGNQSNIALQKRDQNKSHRCDDNRGPVNECGRDQIQRYYGDDTNHCGADAGKECLNRAIFANLFNVMHAAHHKNK